MTLDRSQKILAGIGLAALILTVRLFYVQIFDSRYKRDAISNSVVRQSVEPPRGVIYDREGRVLVGNDSFYDIMVAPREVTAFDTLALSAVLGVEPSFLKDRLKYYRTYRTRIGFKPQVLLKKVPAQTYMRFAEMQYRFPGFYGRLRTERIYPYNAGGNLLGYVAEVDPDYIRRHADYRAGDVAGQTGIEAARESDLRGKRGYNVYTRDSRNRILTPYRGGSEDVNAVPGKDVHTTLDAELQMYGQALMKGKTGSLIALDPSNGEILAMVSSPGLDVEALSDMSSHYASLAADPLKPMFNRSVQASYPPGSVFKLVNGLIGLQEGVLKPSYLYPCNEGFQYTVNKKLGCHTHRSPLNLEEAVMHSCNSYFCFVFKSILENPAYEDGTAEAFSAWERYVRSFGFGSPLGTDVPAESGGSIPSAALYDRIYGHGHWKFASVVSLSIGQGEIGATPLQIANLAAIMANRGWYVTPHIFSDTPAETRRVLVDSSLFEPIVEGMYRAVNAPAGSGATATFATVKGLDICGKTGTAENPHGDDNSVFICFAPRENPRIAVAAYIENAGFGATWACPTASLLVEKYLNGSIGKSRKWVEDYILSANLIKNDGNERRQ